MKIVEAKKIFTSLGWRVCRSEGISFFVNYHLPDRFVDIIPKIVRLGDKEELKYSPYLSADNFVDAYEFIEGRKKTAPALIYCWEGMSMEAPEITEDHFCKASEEVISWAKEQDIDKALEDHAAWPPDMFGTRPIMHFAALSLQNDEKRLKYYRERFAAGNNLGFTKIVSMEKIDRALAFVQKD